MPCGLPCCTSCCAATPLGQCAMSAGCKPSDAEGIARRPAPVLEEMGDGSGIPRCCESPWACRLTAWTCATAWTSDASDKNAICVWLFGVGCPSAARDTCCCPDATEPGATTGGKMGCQVFAGTAADLALKSKSKSSSVVRDDRSCGPGCQTESPVAAACERLHMLRTVSAPLEELEKLNTHAWPTWQIS